MAGPDPNNTGESFFRRIAPYQFDPATNKPFLSAFRNDKIGEGVFSDRHSVDWERYTTVEDTLEGHEGFGVARISGDDYLRVGQNIVHSPKDDNYSHCDAVGEKKNSVQRRLRDACLLLRAPTVDP